MRVSEMRCARPEHKLAAKHVLTLGYRSRSRITAPLVRMAELLIKAGGRRDAA
jgi:hypothetical protein